MKRIGILSVTAVAALTIACAGDRRDADANKPADETAAVGTAGESERKINNGARDWLEDRMMGGMTEVKLGELASQKAQSADVKAFGRRMVQDHGKAGEALKQIATQHNVTPPAQLDDDHREKVDKFSKLTGAEFDREYMKTMVDDHQKTLEAVEDRLDKSGDDKQPHYTPKKTDDTFDMHLNEWSAKTAPTVREHLDLAKTIDQKLSRRTTNNN
jgi:putative membrane protein